MIMQALARSRRFAQSLERRAFYLESLFPRDPLQIPSPAGKCQ